ncbi:Phox-domain containing protein [Akanthomyces lecanii RCEF 1005]|uniref:Phox-domain containing protein n=1 Tax=Akanthomyces lecanii RCEF 1005 TaxID=1081108 RepID=A0A162ITK6_CORDF|nr:Phox-domain containing protein [Akanthomyces lecanii RCEF 1005]
MAHIQRERLLICSILSKQALRRSIKGDKDKSQTAPVTPKSAVAIVPPKKVIRALYDYTARTSQELSFSRGDFFHVIGREEDPDWYEACNPALPDARGLVPVAFFQALGRTERDSAQSEGTGIRPPTANKTPDHDSGYSDASPTSSAIPSQRLSKSGGKGGAMVYGIVMYDFVAERADELNAKAGEAIIVIAQSNPEWFVAKPIGRLGGPGLIPVSFIEIRDMATDRAIANPGDAIKQAGVPRVEEWKKMAAEYKNSSITLGKFEAGQQQMEQGMERLSLQQQAESQAGGHSRAQSTQQAARHVSNSTSDLYAPIQARIPRYCFAEDKYWFVIEAMLEDGRHWELSRYYEDFYDFQIALLTEFPTEAGNTGSQKRSLPYMPGPVSYVTDAITEGRLHNLDAYVKNLLGQPAYISRCTLVKQFFAPREGDYEMDGNTNGQEYRDSQESHQSGSPTNGDSRNGSRSNLNGGGYGGLPSGPRQASGSGPAGQQQQLIKVKMYHGDDLIALRVPRVDTRSDKDAQFKKLQGVIATRLDVSDRDELQLFSLNEQTKQPSNLISAYDLDSVLGKSDKLLLRAEVMRN